MGPRGATAVLVVLIVVGQSFPVMENGDLEDRSDRRETDYGGPITYTDEHTYATLGNSDRSTTLVMPGGHDYDRPLPLVVSLHGYSGWGTQNSAYMGLYDSVHQNEHLLLSPDGTMNWFFQRWWNATDACCNNFDADVDDVGYIEGLIEEAIQNYGADPEGVVVMGLSNGGFMSHRMACDSGGTVRSIVSLNGATWDDFGSACLDTGRPNILHVHSTADGVIQYDGGSILGDEYPSAMESVGHWASRSGCDASMTLLGSIDLIDSDGISETDSYENLNCADGNRVAHWKINNGSHVPSLNDPEWADLTLSWALSGFVRDSDGDGFRDDNDAFPYDSEEWSDNDEDGIGDNADPDDDNDGLTDTEESGLGTDPLNWDTDSDGVSDMADCDPLDGDMYNDTDSDGLCDEADPDADDDGWANDDEFDCMTDWLDALSVPPDLEGDGICDLVDPDDDNDGYFDHQDLFPEDPSEWADNDEDGIGDNADPDDDNDGWLDADEQSCGTDQWSSESIPDDLDGDGICDPLDEDVDGDGYPDDSDHYPLDPSEWADTDGDWVGDNADAFPENPHEWLDTDGDGIGDRGDAFPEDETEWLDTDGDEIGDNTDAFPTDRQEWVDTDGDGVGDNSDAFPEDPNEWSDLDGDGVGDNTDVFPADPYEWIDTDGDGVGDNSDAFPLDVDEWLDTDGDGVGNNADAYPLDSSRWEEEPEYLLIGLGGGLVAIAILAYTGRRHA